MNRNKIELFFGLTSILLIPINKHLVIIFMLFWLVLALSNFIADKIQNIHKGNLSINKSLFLLFPLFYAIHLIGLIYTRNFDYAFFDLEIKLSMLLIPLTLWLRSDFYADKQIQILRALVYGSLISFGINIIQAAIYYQSDPDITYFFYTRLSPIHPSYMALYISLALLSIIYLGPKNIVFNLKYGQIAGISIFLSLLGYLFLLTSKAGIITFAITLTVFIIAHYLHRIKLKYLAPIAFMVILIPIILIYSVPTIKGRFQAMISAIKNGSEASLDSQESSMERVAIFITSSKFAYQNLPWGVGTGDTKDEIILNYKKMGSKTINERYLNAHNQYLQTTITLGIPGLIALFAMIFLGLKTAIKNKNPLFLSFILLISLHMFFESMLEQQAGVIFITLFYTFFCIWEEPKLNNH